MKWQPEVFQFRMFLIRVFYMCLMMTETLLHSRNSNRPSYNIICNNSSIINQLIMNYLIWSSKWIFVKFHSWTIFPLECIYILHFLSHSLTVHHHLKQAGIIRISIIYRSNYYFFLCWKMSNNNYMNCFENIYITQQLIILELLSNSKLFSFLFYSYHHQVH